MEKQVFNPYLPSYESVSYTHLDVYKRQVYLRVNTTQEGLYAKFFYSLDGKDYQELAEVPTNILTDEQSDGFTGAHFGMYCHDMTGVRRYADFDYFEMQRKA